jgi:hypothetical protein
MIFPTDSEIREYAAYEVRTRKIILEEFKHEYGREPNELEIPELLRAAIIPIGFLPRQNDQLKPSQDQPQSNTNSPKNEVKSSPPEQPKNQPAQQVPPKQKPTDSVMDIVEQHKGKLVIEGDRVVKVGKLDDYWKVIDEFKHRGWRFVKPEKTADGWKDGYFEMEAAMA